jgi:hypothetical protein
MSVRRALILILGGINAHLDTADHGPLTPHVWRPDQPAPSLSHVPMGGGPSHQPRRRSLRAQAHPNASALPTLRRSGRPGGRGGRIKQLSRYPTVRGPEVARKRSGVQAAHQGATALGFEDAKQAAEAAARIDLDPSAVPPST